MAFPAFETLYMYIHKRSIYVTNLKLLFWWIHICFNRFMGPCKSVTLKAEKCTNFLWLLGKSYNITLTIALLCQHHYLYLVSYFNVCYDFSNFHILQSHWNYDQHLFKAGLASTNSSNMKELATHHCEVLIGITKSIQNNITTAVCLEPHPPEAWAVLSSPSSARLLICVCGVWVSMSVGACVWRRGVCEGVRFDVAIMDIIIFHLFRTWCASLV